MSQENTQFEYDVAFSFAGENRPYVEQVAAVLRANGVHVFYDEYEKTNLWGKDLYVHLDEVYRKKARYCVMFASEAYERKMWTNHERRSAQARAIGENREYILPARFDDTEIPGVPPTIGYISLKGMPPIDFAGLIQQKLSQTSADSRGVVPVPSLSAPAPTAPVQNDPVLLLEEYVADDRHRVQLYKLFINEREKLVAQLGSPEFSKNGGLSDEQIVERVLKYDEILSEALPFFMAACRWCKENQYPDIVDFFEAVSETCQPTENPFSGLLVKLGRYPALVLLYAAGNVCVKQGRYDLLNLLFKTSGRDALSYRDRISILNLAPGLVLDTPLAQKLPGQDRKYTPLNDHLFDLLKPALHSYIRGNEQYENNFDRFEWLFATSYADAYAKESNDVEVKGRLWGPPGRYVWKSQYGNAVWEQMLREAEASRGWPPITAGMYEGSIERYKKIHDGLTEQSQKINSQR